MSPTIKIQNNDAAEGVEGEAGPTPAAGDEESRQVTGAAAPESAAGSGDNDGAASSVDDWQVTIDNLNREIAALRDKAQDSHDALLRTRADMENMKKRLNRELEHERRYAVENYLRDILPVLDSMELGLQAAADRNTDKAAMCEGMKMTVALFQSFIENLGGSSICPQDEDFDPERHEALAVRDDTGQPKGRVLTVVQKGYMLHDRLVRPAKVIVSG